MIKKTKDYSIFKLMGANRELNHDHLRKLTASIARKNLLAQNPIIVNKKMEVIDGQHRLEVAKNNKWDIYYIVADDANMEDVASLNSTVKTWALKDYVVSFAKQGKSDYQLLLDFSEQFEISIGQSASLLSGEDTHQRASSGFMSSLRSGKFVAWDEKGAIEMGIKLHDLRPHCEGTSVWREAGFIQALKVGYKKGIKHDELLKKLQTTGLQFYKKPTLKDYLRQLEEIYNHKRRDGKVYLFYGDDQ